MTNFEHLEQVLTVLFAGGVTPNLIGHHGIGKTEFIRQYAKKHGYELLEFRLGTCSDSGDLTGVPQIREINSGKDLATVFATPEFFPREGKVILFFDEWNRCQVKEIYQALFNLILERKMNQYVMPVESRVVLAANPSTEDYDVFEFDDAAFRDRVCSIKVQPSTSEFLAYNKTKSPDSKILDFLNTYNNMIAAKVVEFSLSEPKFSGRTWSRCMAMEELVNKLKVEESVFKTILIGMVGVHATNLFLKHAETLVTIKGVDILANYPKLKDLIVKTVKEGKIDVINNIGDEIVANLHERNVVDKVQFLTPDEQENLTQFILDAPKDWSIAFWKTKLAECRVIYQKNMIDDEEAKKETPLSKEPRLDKYFNGKTAKKAS